MFILRRIIEKGGDECNTAIGYHYALILKSRNKEEFERAQKFFDIHQESVFGFISDSSGQLTPLYDGSVYYMMTENGATFERIVKQ